MTPDNEAAVDFLKKVYPNGPWLLTAIHPDRKAISTATFWPHTFDKMIEWLAAFNGERNIYWSTNPPDRELTKKAEREDIKEVVFLHVDVDPRAGENIDDERDRILALFGDKFPKGIPAPTVLLFSGGGYQAFWKLEQPIPFYGDLAAAEDAKRYNQKLEQAFGGDNCHNIDRIMRLPGTMNLPDERKKKKGRLARLATLMSFDASLVYPLSRFAQAPLPTVVAPAGPFVAAPIGDAVRTTDPADLNVPDRLKIIMVQGHHPDEPKEGDNSRSIWVFDFCCGMMRAEQRDEVILGILLDPAYEISKSVLEKPNPHRYAVRQIENARKYVSQDVDFDVGDGGKTKQTPKNYRVAMQKLGVSVRHDVFSDRLLIDGLPNYTTINDASLTRLRLAINDEFHFLPTRDLFYEVVTDAARHTPFHPVREYLDSVKWDGEPRIDRWLVTYGGAEDTKLTRAVGELVLIAAVRRVRSPGCKFDEMLVLESAQGTDKSSALAILAKQEEWFSDDLPLNQTDGAKVIERLNGKWIVEAAELKGMRGGQADHLKAFLSRRVDIGRPAYGRLPVEAPRQSVFIGTTNDENFLKDNTGNRRFWPAKIEKFNLTSLRRDVDQLWAEAAHREAEGCSIRLDPELYADAAVEQAARKMEEPWVDVLKGVLGDHEGKVRQVELWLALGIPTGQLTQAHPERLKTAMAELGWDKRAARFGAGTEKAYLKGRAKHPQRILVERDSYGKVRAYYEDYEDVRHEPSPF